MSVCPRFHDARVAVHNQIRGNLSAALRRALPGGWNLHEETPMANTGLRLTPVSTVSVQQSGRSVRESDVAAGMMHLGRWQPDLLLVSHSRRKIAIVDVIRPSDIRRDRLSAAYQDKLRIYEPLRQALDSYASSLWEIRILPWVVGSRGLVQHSALTSALEFLEIPAARWPGIISGTVQAAVAGLVLMHRVRFSHANSQRNLESDLEDTVPRSGAKRSASNLDGGYAEDMERWKRMAAERWRRS